MIAAPAKRSPFVVVRRDPFSFRVPRRLPIVLLVLALLLTVVLVLNIGTGQYRISPIEVVQVLLGLPTADPQQPFIVLTLRLPRALVAMLVGVGLATAGAILQGLTRNPLASPEIVGVSGGAGAAAVTLIVLFPNVPAGWIPVASFAGALLVAAVIAAISWTGRAPPLRLILVGIGIAAITNALTTMLTTFGAINRVTTALIWLAGSVYGRSWDQFWPLVPWIAIGLPVAFSGARHLDLLGLGDDLSRGLGSAVERQRLILLVTAVALAASAVATAGGIGFIGLMAPHLARRIVGPAHLGLLPTAALIGGLLVVAADLVGRSIFAPLEIPCGVITAVIGAPYFISLLMRTR